MNENLIIKLVISSDRISKRDLNTFKIGLEIHNTSNGVNYFDISQTELFVNDIRSFAWDLTVQNGTIINLKILPKRFETVQWLMGEALFSEEGKYLLRLELKNKTLLQNVIVFE
ncbi:hypothetical protein [Aquimarina sp. 2201CG5-10]|uniref:hypothetical protein n=1 Tax=Aquimarina callyspongiae TaxID=3098150 RepID=UPI002AB3A775|nr:hypothetical protein [Aquimarina sp. 2201CG5-10]MDY8138085.1 hypothetical protein [Aquimarina sp. 2201CG5-10]